MPFRFRTLLFCLALLLPLTGCSALKSWGLMRYGTDEVLASDTPEQIYEKAQRLFAREEWDDAADGFEKLWRENPHHALASDAQFYEAECRYGDEDWHGAFTRYRAYLEDHPLSPHVPLVQRRLYEMGKFLVREGAEGWLGIFDYSDEGIEILDYLVTAFPHGSLSDWALIYAADHEMQDHQYEAAIDHLHDLLDLYPQSEWALGARLRLARAYRDLNRGAAYDLDALKRSDAQYAAYLDVVSRDEARAGEYAAALAEARAERAEVRETLARKGLDNADFYLRGGHPDAAREALRQVLADYPDTRGGAEARERLGIDGEGTE